MALRDNCKFPPGFSVEAAKHYSEVIDAIEQIYPGARSFVVIVQDEQTQRTFWDVSDTVEAIGLVEIFKGAQIAGFMGIRVVQPGKGDQP